MEKRVNFKDVQKDDLMALVTFVKVTAKSGSSNATMFSAPRIKVRTTDSVTPADFDVEGQELIEQMFSADRFETTEELSKTQLAEKLVSSYNVPFTVEFEKADGNLRKLRGRLVHPEPLLGRSKVEDLDLNVKPMSNLRLVDHRTIQSLIVNGVKYILKDK